MKTMPQIMLVLVYVHFLPEAAHQTVTMDVKL